MSRHILAIDQGTTNSKAILLRDDGRIAASASRPVPIRYPAPAWVEQDAAALWSSVREAADECVAATGITPAAVAVTNQRETVVAWDRRTGLAVGPAIVWQCRRTADFCASLRTQGHGRLLLERTGLGIDPLFSASKARWLLDSIPGGRAKAAAGDVCLGTVDAWILFQLTGGAVHACDLTNASRTQLLNLERQCWDADLLSLFDIPKAALPEVKPSSALYGECRLWGGAPVGCLIGDSHGAFFGHGIFAPGAVKATYGTGSSLMTMTQARPRSRHGLSATIAWSRAGDTRYALEGNIAVTGGTVQWLGDFLSLPGGAPAVAELARTVEDSGGVYLVPAFAGLGAPHWRDDARGTLSGLTRGSTAAHAARAAIESIAYQVRDVFDAMRKDAGLPLPELLADGGAAFNDDLMQFQADILGHPVVRRASADLSAVGAAQLAGLSTGLWPSLDALAALPRDEKRFEPALPASGRDRLYTGWQDAVARVLAVKR